MEVAREILNVVTPYVTSVDALWTACALALLHPETLLDAPETTLEKLLILLAPACPPASLSEAARRVGREIACGRAGPHPWGEQERYPSGPGHPCRRSYDKLPSIAPTPRVLVADQLPVVAVRHAIDAPPGDAEAATVDPSIR